MDTFYTIYQITNKLNGKTYVGSHKTKQLDDTYMGSGKILRRAIAKYGEDNFTKDILFVFDNPEDMYGKEAEIVNESFVSRTDTYNLKVGGEGGWDYINGNKDIIQKRGAKAAATTHEILRERYKDDPKQWTSHMHTQEVYDKIKEAKRLNPLPHNWLGKKHTEETRKLMSESAKARGSNSTGTQWICNVTLKQNKKIKRGDPIPDGWKPGRKMKF